MSDENIVIVSARRTPIGSFQGELSSFKATELGSKVVKRNLEETKLNANEIDEVIMGCVLPAGLGQAPSRQVSIGAGIPVTVGATTINKMCGSGMKAIMIGYDSIVSGNNNIVVSGGSTMFQGFGQRLLREVTDLAPKDVSGTYCCLRCCRAYLCLLL